MSSGIKSVDEDGNYTPRTIKNAEQELSATDIASGNLQVHFLCTDKKIYRLKNPSERVINHISISYRL